MSYVDIAAWFIFPVGNIIDRRILIALFLLLGFCLIFPNFVEIYEILCTILIVLILGWGTIQSGRLNDAEERKVEQIKSMSMSGKKSRRNRTNKG